MSDIIAERRFQTRNDDGSIGEITIKVNKPYVDPTRDDSWLCQIVIEESGSEYARVVDGADSLQALKHAVRLVQVHIRNFDMLRKGKITWLGTDDLLIDEVYSPSELSLTEGT